MNKKLCLIFSHASVYREPIYRLIDQTFDCEWHFSDEDGGVKRFDTSIFKNVTIHRHTRLKRFHWISGINKLLRKKDNTTFLMLAGTVDLSCWLFFLRAKLFYPKKKIYLWGHGWYGKETKMEAFIKRTIFKSVSGGIFSYGNYARELMIREGIPADKLFVLHNSLNYDTQRRLRESVTTSEIYIRHFGNSNPNIIFIGRLTQVKRLDQLVDALGVLKTQGVNMNLTFIGDGPMRQDLEIRVNSLGLQDRVWFYGACYDEIVNADFVYNADLCVAPGNIGLTAMHTMVFGTPVLSHNDFKWQMPEFEAIHPGLTGDFFERDNVDDIATTIKNWFAKNGAKRDEIRRNCMNEIDTQWNPYFQIEVIKKNIVFAEL